MRKGDRVRVKRTGAIGVIVWIGGSNATLYAQYEVELDSGIKMFLEYELEAAG